MATNPSRTITTALFGVFLAVAALGAQAASVYKCRGADGAIAFQDHACAAGVGRIALIVYVIGLAVTLGLSPAAKLQWASHFLVANLLVLAVMWGGLFEYAASAVLHWRARR